MLHYSRPQKTIEVKDMPIRLAGVIKESIVDGPNLRFVVFVQGCPHRCKGCHNPDTHNYNGGFLTSTRILWDEIIKNPLLRGVTFSGGEPFVWAEELAEIGRAALENGMSVLTYSGYTYEQLIDMSKNNKKGVRDLLTVSNYLIDGQYVEAKRDLSLLFRGSSNQRIFDITCYPNSENATVIQKFESGSR